MSQDEAADEAPRVVGSVTFDEGGRTVEASLHEDGRWRCAGSPGVADDLNRECAPDPGGEADSRRRDALVKSARRLRGSAWLGPDRPEGPPPSP